MTECFDCLGTGTSGGVECPTCCGTGFEDDTDYMRPSSEDNPHPEGCECSLCDPYDDYNVFDDEYDEAEGEDEF